MFFACLLSCPKHTQYHSDKHDASTLELLYFLCRLPGSGRPSKITTEISQTVDDQKRSDDEKTAIQLYHLLKARGHPLSLRTILRCRSALGWTFRGSAYCQLIRQPNKVKRLSWAQENVGNTFENVVWTDETSVQLQTHRRFCCRKRGEL